MKLVNKVNFHWMKNGSFSSPWTNHSCESSSSKTLKPRRKVEEDITVSSIFAYRSYFTSEYFIRCNNSLILNKIGRTTFE